MTRQFVATGTGRCGTAWIASAMTRLGHRCVHEGIFNPTTLIDGSWRRKLDRGVCGASWLAMGVLNELPQDVAIVAIVRHPLHVIRSLRGIKFFATDTAYSRIARGMFELPDDPLEAAAWWWIHVNRQLFDRADVVVQIENPDLRSVVSLLDAREYSDARFREVAKIAPMNARTRNEEVALDMLAPNTRNALRVIAAMLGYET